MTDEEIINNNKLMKDVVCEGINQYLDKYDDYKKEREKICDQLSQLDYEMEITENNTEQLKTELSIITDLPDEKIGVTVDDGSICIMISDKIKLLDIFSELVVGCEGLDVRCYAAKRRIMIKS